MSAVPLGASSPLLASSVPTIAYGAITPSSPMITARSPSATMIPIPSVEEDHYSGGVTNHDDTSMHSMDLFQLSSAAAAASRHSHTNSGATGTGSGSGSGISSDDRADTIFACHDIKSNEGLARRVLHPSIYQSSHNAAYRTSPSPSVAGSNTGGSDTSFDHSNAHDYKSSSSSSSQRPLYPQGSREVSRGMVQSMSHDSLHAPSLMSSSSTFSHRSPQRSMLSASPGGGSSSSLLMTSSISSSSIPLPRAISSAIRVRLARNGATSSSYVTTTILPSTSLKELLHDARHQMGDGPYTSVWDVDGIPVESPDQLQPDELLYVGGKGEVFRGRQESRWARVWQLILFWLCCCSGNTEHALNRDKVRDIESSNSVWADPDFDIGKKNLERVFGSLDKERRGEISREKFKEGIARFTKQTLSSSEMDRLVAQVDLQDTGFISKPQFTQTIQELTIKSRFASAPKESLLHELFVYDFSADSCIFRSLPSLNFKEFIQEPAGPLPGYKCRWIHLSGQHLPTFLAIANVYGLHHLEVEDAMGVNERPRVVRHEDKHLQIMLQMIRAKKKSPLRLKDEQVSLFVVKNTVITCQEKLTATFTVPLQRRLPDPGSKLRQNGADFLAYSIIDLVVDQASTQVMRFNRDLMSLERRVHKSGASGQIEPEVVRNIHRVAREMNMLGHWVKPIQLMIPKLVEVSSDLGVYYSDVLDHTHFIAEKVAIILTWTITLQQHAASLQAARVNGVLLLLSVIGTIFAPVQFLSSVYGMNFKHNFPELEWEYGYITFWICCVVITICSLIMFKRKGWWAQ